MLTCPNCSKDMHPVCGNKNCICHKQIPEGERPMNNCWLTFYGIVVPEKFGDILWELTWFFDWGSNIHDFIEKIYRKFKGEHESIPYSWLWIRKIGIQPSLFLFEVQECPYCGFKESMSYWEDRNITQTFPDGNWDNPIY